MEIKKTSKGFTILELLVVVSIVAILLSFLFPALSKARQSARRLQGTSDIRSIYFSVIFHAEENNGWYVGLESDGTARQGQSITGTGRSGEHTHGRLAIMLTEHDIDPSFFISPSETDASYRVWDRDTNVVASTNTSYAMTGLRLSVVSGTPVHKSWSNYSSGSMIPIVSDRNRGVRNGSHNINGTTTAYSIWTSTPGNWRGNIAWDDGHVTFELSPTVATNFGTVSHSEDFLFDRRSPRRSNFQEGYHATMAHAWLDMPWFTDDQN